MLKIKDRGNDAFTFATNSANNRKILASRGYIKEVGQCLFIYNQETELWECYDARYTFVAIPDRPVHERIYNVWDSKFGLFGKIKWTGRPPRNKIEFAKDEVNEACGLVASRGMTYRQLYEFASEHFNLPPFHTVKGRDDQQ